MMGGLFSFTYLFSGLFPIILIALFGDTSLVFQSTGIMQPL